MEAQPRDGWLLQLRIPLGIRVLLSRLMMKRTEEGRKPSECTRSYLVMEAIRLLALAEGIDPEAGQNLQTKGPASLKATTK